MRAAAAFTLVEMLVVIAITVILFALLLRPLVESLRLTSSAQAQAAAQDSGRITLERLTRELGSAVFVYDNNSHPFVNYAVPANAAGGNTRYDRFTNFLNLGVTKSDGTVAVEHAYNAKLDIVPARHSGGGSLTDPTAGDEPVTVKKGALSSNGLLFPLAPGSYITRYWVGLKDPTKPYTNSNEGLLAAASTNGDNTYILYSAQVQPYKTMTATGTTPAATSLNTAYFTAAADGKTPELDDPDFFRYVGATDVNWLSDDHHLYTASELTAHNARVDEWYKVAKPVITAPDIDLILLPHNPDGTVAYDKTATAANVANVAHSGTSIDPVKNVEYPTVNTSVTFAPATVQGDAAPGTTADYSSLGIPANAVDNGGLPYVPTLYTASNQSLVNPPAITLSSNVGNDDATSVPFYTTGLASAAAMAQNGLTVNPGDLVEYYHTNSNDKNGTAVFDITQGVVLKGAAGRYVPFSVNANTGTLNFDTPALPAPPDQNSTVTYNPYQRFWSAAPMALNNGLLEASQADPNAAGGRAPGVIDLTQLFCDNTGALTTTGGYNTSPLSALGLTTVTAAMMLPTPGPLATANAFIVPGSVRIYGPDATPGPGLGTRVLYTPVGPGTPLGFNQYHVDYRISLVSFYVDNANKLPEQRADGTAADPVQIAFDYQANLAPPDKAQPISSGNPSANPPILPNIASPMLVKVDYQTRDLLDINIGVRIYDSSQGRSIIVPVHNRVQIGNSNR